MPIGPQSHFEPLKDIKSLLVFLKSYSPKQPTVCELLEKKKIVIAVREILDKKILRASPHFFNSEEDIQKVIEEIRKL